VPAPEQTRLPGRDAAGAPAGFTGGVQIGCNWQGVFKPTAAEGGMQMTRNVLSSLAVVAILAMAPSQLTMSEASSQELRQSKKSTAAKSGGKKLVNPTKQPKKSIVRFGGKDWKLCLGWGGDKCK
jgi:hypothetical protein